MTVIINRDFGGTALRMKWSSSREQQQEEESKGAGEREEVRQRKLAGTLRAGGCKRAAGVVVKPSHGMQMRKKPLRIRDPEVS
ncbi:hypothetical protein VSDG_07042 [Cytospora chrysosperma]|uniref:Uncharacterized protein n=1 Tax=Cytospora chrysosperma TaxID=252740 RepID=A0A423VV56_CYTCH|nr:hypothetical protein VSDG_07042 [Valsa sordida]